MVLDQYAWEPPDETLSLNQKGAFERRHRVMAPTVIEARISSWALLFLRAPFLKITFTRNLIASICEMVAERLVRVEGFSTF